MSGNQTKTADIVERLNAACVGHPHARISWPHYLLHDARAEIEWLRAEVAGLKIDLAGAIHNRVYDQRDAYSEGLSDAR